MNRTLLTALAWTAVLAAGPALALRRQAALKTPTGTGKSAVG